MNEDISLTPLRLAILGLIAMHPQSGYDLKKIFETTPMGNFSSSPGAIYPALKSLEKKGWIRGEPDKTDSLRPRLVYSITDEGDAVLRAELEKPVTHDDLIWHFDLIMLRFAFIERIGYGQALRFLGEFRAESEAYAEHLEGLRDQLREQLSPCGRLALEHGIQGSRGNVIWAEQAIGELEQLEKE
ncbi:MAG: PadR family transcriptional regulator [Acidobacteria bacterium]|jgi:DNA-binding PadR family transcriptional regulator|nr:PadR family transcriptional regulator [Acidobacteriota bacterium]